MAESMTPHRTVPALGGLAGVLAGGGFCLLHLPGWGIGPVMVYIATVGVALSFFAWRRDLLANIVAHAVVDGMALIVMPALALVH